MLWFVLLLSHVNADVWVAYNGGFVSESRQDAPLDARLVYATDFEPVVTVTEGPGAPFTLELAQLLNNGAVPRASISPPQGGWAPETDYTVSVDFGEYDAYDIGITEMSFRTGSETAPSADTLQVDRVSVGPWSEASAFEWGWGFTTRNVEVVVSMPDADPWAYIEVVGDFRSGHPTRITDEPQNGHLVLEMGAGTHKLLFHQWIEDGQAQPACFDVVAVSAAGVAGAFETFCEDDVGLGLSDTDTQEGCGCASVNGGVVPLVWWMTLLALFRRRRRADALLRP